MSIIDDEERSTLSNNSVHSVFPCTPDKVPLVWDDNDATINGMLHELGRFLIRTGKHKVLLKYRAAQLSNGKLAVDSYPASSSSTSSR